MPGVIRGCWCRDWRVGGEKTEYPGTAEGYREICQRSLDKWQVRGTALPEQGEDKQRQQVRSSEQTEGVALPITRYFTASQDQPFSFRSSLRGAAASTRGCGIKKLRDGFLVGMGRRSRSGGDMRSVAGSAGAASCWQLWRASPRPRVLPPARQGWGLSVAGLSTPICTFLPGLNRQRAVNVGAGQ